MDKTIRIKHPVEDITVILPNGEKIVLQYRDDGGTFPSLDICFEKQRQVTCWARDMEPAKQIGKNPEDRECFQLWVGLDPKQPNY